MFSHFKDYHGNHKNFKSLYGFGGRCLKIRDVSMDFEAYFKVHNSIVHLGNAGGMTVQPMSLNSVLNGASNGIVQQLVRRRTKTWAMYSCSFPHISIRAVVLRI